MLLGIDLFFYLLIVLSYCLTILIAKGTVCNVIVFFYFGNCTFFV